MGAFSDIFAAPQQAQQVPMAAPGVPLYALSGNPAATVTNLAAIGGGQMGGAIGGPLGDAIGQALSAPMVDPVALDQQRMQQFYSDVQSGMANGLSYGESLQQAAKGGYLAPDERLDAMSEAQELMRNEQKVARDTSKALYNSDAYKGFVDSKNNWQAMKELAGKDPKSINDFTIIQRFLKTIDPDSATLQGEIDAAKLSATGMQSLRSVFGKSETANIIANLMRFQAGGGNKLTLNENQKRALLSAAGEVVQAKQKGALAAYDQFQSQYLGTGGSQRMFNEVSGAALNQLDWSMDGQLAEAGITSGTMPNDWLRLAEMAERKADAVNKAITNLAVDGAKYSAMFAADFAVGGASAAWESFQNWRNNTFGPEGDDADAVGAAMTLDPTGTAVELQNTWGMDSTPLNMILDMATGSKTSRRSGVTSINPVIERLKTGKSGLAGRPLSRRSRKNKAQ